MKEINWNSTYEGERCVRFVIPIGEIDEEQLKERLRELRKMYSEETNLDINEKNDITGGTPEI